MAPLLARDPAAQVNLDDRAVGDLVDALGKAQAVDAAIELAVRAADRDLFWIMRKSDVVYILKFPFGREPDGKPSPPWGWHDLD